MLSHVSVSRICYRFLTSESKENIQKLVGKNKVVIFMKGIPESPRCGFSNAVVQILRMHGVQYDSYNVLENDQLRQGMYNFDINVYYIIFLCM